MASLTEMIQYAELLNERKRNKTPGVIMGLLSAGMEGYDKGMTARKQSQALQLEVAKTQAETEAKQQDKLYKAAQTESINLNNSVVKKLIESDNIEVMKQVLVTDVTGDHIDKGVVSSMITDGLEKTGVTYSGGKVSVKFEKPKAEKGVLEYEDIPETLSTTLKIKKGSKITAATLRASVDVFSQEQMSKRQDAKAKGNMKIQGELDKQLGVISDELLKLSNPRMKEKLGEEKVKELIEHFNKRMKEITGKEKEVPPAQKAIKFKDLPSAGDYKGKTLKHDETGIIYRSDGKKWFKIG